MYFSDVLTLLVDGFTALSWFTGSTTYPISDQNHHHGLRFSKSVLVDTRSMQRSFSKQVHSLVGLCSVSAHVWGLTALKPYIVNQPKLSNQQLFNLSSSFIRNPIRFSPRNTNTSTNVYSRKNPYKVRNDKKLCYSL